MSYHAPIKKLELLTGILSDTLIQASANSPIPVRQLAMILGKVASLRRSHGSVVAIMSRSLQHEVGLYTSLNGWEGEVQLSANAQRELSFLLDILRQYNGQYIFFISISVPCL